MLTESLRQVFGVAAVVASDGLALKDVDVVSHKTFPGSINDNVYC